MHIPCSTYSTLFISIFSCVFFTLSAQTNVLSKNTHKALNRYITYSNETVHAFEILHSEFNRINRSLNRYAEKKADTIACTPIHIFNNYAYFSTLPREIYRDASNLTQHLPYQDRGKALLYLGKVEQLSQRVRSLQKELYRYIQAQTYKRDRNLEQAYKLLDRVEVAYYDFNTIQEKLTWTLNIMHTRFSLPQIDSNMQNLLAVDRPLLLQSQTLLKLIYSNVDKGIIRQQQTELKKTIEGIRKQEEQLFRSFPKDSTNALSVYNKHEELLTKTAQFVAKSEQLYAKNYPSNSPLPAYYRRYNALIFLYNRHNNGLSHIYNEWIKFNKVPDLYQKECIPLYKPIYPNIPAYDSLKVDTLPDAAALAAQFFKARQDSLNKLDRLKLADSLRLEKRYSMKGYAKNNLIFLIDASISMKTAQKLPLLKASLRKFVQLLRPEDQLTIITYSSRSALILDATSAQDTTIINAALEQIKSLGSSNVENGLAMAYSNMYSHKIENGNNRIILATDGGIKISKKTIRRIKKGKKRSIALSVFYFSDKEYEKPKSVLTKLTEVGGGTYNFITPDNLNEHLVEEAQAIRN